MKIKIVLIIFIVILLISFAVSAQTLDKYRIKPSNALYIKRNDIFSFDINETRYVLELFSTSEQTRTLYFRHRHSKDVYNVDVINKGSKYLRFKDKGYKIIEGKYTKDEQLNDNGYPGYIEIDEYKLDIRYNEKTDAVYLEFKDNKNKENNETLLNKTTESIENKTEIIEEIKEEILNETEQQIEEEQEQKNTVIVKKLREEGLLFRIFEFFRNLF